MRDNSNIKKLRTRLNLTQTEFAERIGVSQGTIADIERGRIGVSKNVKSKIIEKVGVESGFFDKESTSKKTDGNQGAESGSNQEILRKKMMRSLQINKLLEVSYPDFYELEHDIGTLFSMAELLEDLQRSKIGKTIFIDVDNLNKEESFNDFKTLTIKAFEDILPYKEILHEYAEASRQFVTKLASMQDDLGLDISAYLAYL